MAFQHVLRRFFFVRVCGLSVVTSHSERLPQTLVKPSHVMDPPLLMRLAMCCCMCSW